jgi:hypothetical protein
MKESKNERDEPADVPPWRREDRGRRDRQGRGSRNRKRREARAGKKAKRERTSLRESEGERDRQIGREREGNSVVQVKAQLTGEAKGICGREGRVSSPSSSRLPGMVSSWVQRGLPLGALLPVESPHMEPATAGHAFFLVI